jgi:hypothetical protein
VKIRVGRRVLVGEVGRRDEWIEHNVHKVQQLHPPSSASPSQSTLQGHSPGAAFAVTTFLISDILRAFEMYNGRCTGKDLGSEEEKVRSKQAVYGTLRMWESSYRSGKRVHGCMWAVSGHWGTPPMMTHGPKGAGGGCEEGRSAERSECPSNSRIAPNSSLASRERMTSN